MDTDELDKHIHVIVCLLRLVQHIHMLKQTIAIVSVIRNERFMFDCYTL